MLKYFLGIFLAQLIIYSNAHAWAHIHRTFNIYNYTNHRIHVFKTHGYQMNTDDDPSASQYINPRGSGKINFWGQYQANNYDYDDGLDFDVVDENGSLLTHFRIEFKGINPITFTIGKHLSGTVLSADATPSHAGAVYIQF